MCRRGSASLEAALPTRSAGSSFKRAATAAAVLVIGLLSASAAAQPVVSRVLFRVFLSDGRVLSSYGEWARVDDRVIFSMPAQLTRDPIELHLVSIPSRQVDWPRTESYAASVRAAAYAATRGEADFARFSSEVASTLNEVAKISDPALRLATAELARQKLAEWPNAHFGYRIADVRDALSMLDEVIAQLRVAVGITRFDLSLSAPMIEPPPPPLPPPSDAELVEQFVAAASITESPAERMGLLQTVLRVIDRAVALLPQAWAERMRSTAAGELDRERQVEKAYDDLRRTTLESAARLASRGRRSDLEKLRDQVKAEDKRLGGHRDGDIAALLATIDLQAAMAIDLREAEEHWDKRAPLYRRYRRAMNGSFDVFKKATIPLEQVRAMSGPVPDTIGPLAQRLARASRNIDKVKPPDELAQGHALIRSAWELADNALRLRLEAVADNNMDVAQRASSAAAGALMLYQRARAVQQSVMDPPGK
jgi:hypothetical protein